jgi:hypothetical protein
MSGTCGMYEGDGKYIQNFSTEVGREESIEICGPRWGII